jgi:hypothetical protein
LCDKEVAMARTTRVDREMAEAVELVGDTIEDAIRETLEQRSPEPARAAIEQLTQVDDEFTLAGEPPPGWTMGYITLVQWARSAAGALADRPDRAADVLTWIENHIGRRYAARARYTVGMIGDADNSDEIALYLDALRDDFLPTLVWIMAAVVDLYGGGDPGWARKLESA